MPGQHPPMWVWLGNEKYDGLFEQRLFDDIVVPSMLRARDEYMELARSVAGAATEASADDQGAAPAQQKPGIVLTLDGEQRCLVAAMEAMPPTSDIRLVKLAASCSKTQQACDVGKGFLALKGTMSKAEYENPRQCHLPGYFPLLKAKLEKLEFSSKSAFLYFFAKLPEYLSQAQTIRNLRSGFVQAGTYPLDIGALLGQCTSFDELSTAEARAAAAAIKPLAHLVALNGSVSDAEIEAELGMRLQPEVLDKIADADLELPLKACRPMEALCINRRRALLANHDKIHKVAARPAGPKQKVRFPRWRAYQPDRQGSRKESDLSSAQSEEPSPLTSSECSGTHARSPAASSSRSGSCICQRRRQRAGVLRGRLKIVSLIFVYCVS